MRTRNLNDYQPFEITVTPSNLQTGETVEVSVEDVDNQILFLNIENTITGRAPFTYTSVDLDFDIKLTCPTAEQQPNLSLFLSALEMLQRGLIPLMIY